MTLREAVERLVLGDGRELPVIGTQGLRTMFHADDDSAFNMGIGRLVDLGLLERVARGVYLNRAAAPMGRPGLGTVVSHLRSGHTSYLSYESALAEFGSISQVPAVYIVATTGNSGQYQIPYGDIEFTHTSRSEVEIFRNTEFDDRINMLVATPELAYEDLRRVRPSNLHLIDEETHAEVLSDWRGRAGA